ncbi:polycomb group protein EMBRYONIC FLOWER 2 isoform X2 [Vigna radiata var. radiata]|uniref:Polycomb group protein EMBRYONIC FLOWER 2 isoform X2 n=1 Tax=Vigna radiata var. radiata TaxID=3916 RepID=A0A1S3VSA4_VIGRR|nr:polycomb group protein EMBRYONIC FLOWER 2 isoform X2 [Vigna radiata var. radiata]
MCRQNSLAHHSGEEEIAADESLLVYCKPVELYNILYRRGLQNPSFLSRCLRYKITARQKRRLRAGIVIFNYRDHYNMLRKTEVTEDFSCPFCLMQCGSFKGLRLHLCSSHDLFNFEFWVTEDYQAVNVSVKVDILRSENVADGIIPQLQTFFFCSRPRKRRRKDSVQNEKRSNVKFMELDSPEDIQNGFILKDDAVDILCCKGENVSRTSRNEKILLSGRNDGRKSGPDHPGTMDDLEHVESSFNISGVSIAMPQSSGDPECSKSVCKSDPALPVKSKKLSMDRSDSRNRMLLQKRLFFHSHRVQPMAPEQVLSDRDSEDEVDDDIADLEDRRMLDDFVDVSKDEKQLMHLWNSFMRKQRVLADGHVPWACEAFSKLHGKELVTSPTLFWCWRLFMIKLWNHGLLDACTMNNCNRTLDSYRNGGLGTSK